MAPELDGAHRRGSGPGEASPTGPLPPSGARGLSPTAIAVVATGLVLVASFAYQWWSLRHGASGIGDYARVLRARGIGPHHLPYVDRPLEYPPLVAAFGYVSTFVGRGSRTLLVTNALPAAAGLLAVSAVLARRFGVRVWWWVLGPPLFLYAFHSWDALAVTGAVLGAELCTRRRDLLGGVALGLGGAAKIYPLLAVPAIAAQRLREGDRRGAQDVVVGAALGVLLPALPFLVLGGGSGMWRALRFQGHRHATWGTLWGQALRVPVLHRVLGAHEASILNLAMLLALVGVVVLAAVLAHRGFLDEWGIAAVTTAGCMLTAKVWSPGYDLWLLPACVAIAVPWRRVLTFLVTSTLVYVVVFGYLHEVFSRAVPVAALTVLVPVRALAVVGIAIAAIRPPAPEPPDEPRVLVGANGTNGP